MRIHTVPQTSGSADPYHRLPDPDLRIRTTDLRIRNLLFTSVTCKMPQKIFFFNNFFCLLLFDGTLTTSTKMKSHKEVLNSRNQGFSYYFCLMKGSVQLMTDPDPGGPKTLFSTTKNLGKMFPFQC
jgi:hypothetical protein